jgi:hypothetical protein
MFLSRLLDRTRVHRGARDAESECRTSVLDEGLAADYQSLIESELRRWRLRTECLRVRVQSVGRRADGFEVFAGLLTLVEWERDTAVCISLGLPILDARVRKLVQASWLPEYSHYDGLWMHPSSQLRAPRELKDLLASLMPPVPRLRDDDVSRPVGVPQSDMAPLTPP